MLIGAALEDDDDSDGDSSVRKLFNYIAPRTHTKKIQNAYLWVIKLNKYITVTYKSIIALPGGEVGGRVQNLGVEQNSLRKVQAQPSANINAPIWTSGISYETRFMFYKTI